MKYFDNRQNTLRFSEEDMESVFKGLADGFSHKWIIRKGSHPLQLLWNRRDFLATNELYTFGSYLKQLSEIDRKWVQQRIKDIKIDNRNQQQGALFEICALGMLINGGHKVYPSKGNTPGYDGTLKMACGKKINISIKNYNISIHYRDFLNRSAEIEKEFVRLLKKENVYNAQMVIDAHIHYPSAEAWNKLKKDIPVVLQAYKKDSKAMFGILPDLWAGLIVGLHETPEVPLHTNYQSYTFIASSVFHKNEENNLFAKLDEACYNLVKHCREDDEQINVAFIRIPENISIAACESFVLNYFSLYPDKPITGVILYQPSVATDITKDENFIHHAYRLVFRQEKYLKWNNSNEKINFTPTVGIASFVPTSLKIITSIGEQTQEIDYNNKYIYQRGNHYMKQLDLADGTKTGYMKQLGSGIFRHAVLKPFPDQAEFIISGRFPPENKLLIL